MVSFDEQIRMYNISRFLLANKFESIISKIVAQIIQLSVKEMKAFGFFSMNFTPS